MTLDVLRLMFGCQQVGWSWDPEGWLISVPRGLSPPDGVTQLLPWGFQGSNEQQEEQVPVCKRLSSLLGHICRSPTGQGESHDRMQSQGQRHLTTQGCGLREHGQSGDHTAAVSLPVSAPFSHLAKGNTPKPPLLGSVKLNGMLPVQNKHIPGPHYLPPTPTMVSSPLLSLLSFLFLIRCRCRIWTDGRVLKTLPAQEKVW